MTNENIRKINTLGKVSKIILMIMRVFCIIGIAACIVGSIIVLFVPKNDFITVTGTASAQVILDDSAKIISKNDLFSIGHIKIASVNDLEECDESINILGTKADLKIDETIKDGKMIYDINLDLDAKNMILPIMGACGACIAVAVFSAVMLVIVIFGGKLAKALEICKSPFEDNVIKAMKHFAFSLIPLGVVYLFDGGINITAAVLVIAVIIFYYIFKHGAELQKESDETV